MSDDIFRIYCEQHARALAWFKHHQILVDNPSHASKITDIIQGHKNDSIHKNHGKRKNRGKAKKSKASGGRHHERDYYASDKGHNNENFEMVVTDEIVEFFRISAEHKKAREERKQMLMEIESDQEEDSMEPSFSNVDKPGEKREQEMKELYGEGATMIIAMETAMRLSFQKCCDQKAPKLWPTLPLNIKFDTVDSEDKPWTKPKSDLENSRQESRSVKVQERQKLKSLKRSREREHSPETKETKRRKNVREHPSPTIYEQPERSNFDECRTRDDKRQSYHQSEFREIKRRESFGKRERGHDGSDRYRDSRGDFDRSSNYEFKTETRVHNMIDEYHQSNERRYKRNRHKETHRSRQHRGERRW